MEKATDTGQVAQKINKLFYREILLEKATNTGHVAPNHSLRSFSLQEVEVVGERKWLLHSQSKKVLKENTARARLARV